MARRVGAIVWRLKPQETQDFGKLRQALDLTDKVIAENIDMDPATFSQAQRGLNQKGFDEERKDRLKNFLQVRVAEALARGKANGDAASALLADSLFNVLFGASEELVASRLLPPGVVLPLEASNYVTRDADTKIDWLIQSHGSSGALLGGPRSGRSSLLERIHHKAKLRRSVHLIKLRKLLNFQPTGTGGSRALSLAEVVDAIANELVPSKDNRQLFKGIPLEFIPGRLSNQLKQLFARPELRDALVLIDDFDELHQNGMLKNDVAHLTCAFFSHGVREYGATLVLSVDPCITSITYVSEVVSRAIELSMFSVYHFTIQELAMKTLGAADAALVTATDVLEILSNFSTSIFLCHCTLDRINSTKINAYAAVEAVLKVLRERPSPSTDDAWTREIARFQRRVENLLRQCDRLAQDVFQGVVPQPSPISEALKRGEVADLPTHYVVWRALRWTGCLGPDDRIPTYIQIIATRMGDVT